MFHNQEGRHDACLGIGCCRRLRIQTHALRQQGIDRNNDRASGHRQRIGTMFALSIGTSVRAPVANPSSAWVRAGASLMPWPTLVTRVACAWAVQRVRALGNLKDKYSREHVEQHGVEPYEAAITLVRAMGDAIQSEQNSVIVPWQERTR